MDTLPLGASTPLRAVEWVGTPTRLYGLDRHGNVVHIFRQCQAAPRRRRWWQR